MDYSAQTTAMFVFIEGAIVVVDLGGYHWRGYRRGLPLEGLPLDVMGYHSNVQQPSCVQAKNLLRAVQAVRVEPATGELD